MQRSAADLKAIHRFSSHHRELLQRSGRAGCFFCCAFVDPLAVRDWTDDGQTALCPLCGIDAMLPDTAPVQLDAPLLAEMHDHWFGD